MQDNTETIKEKVDNKQQEEQLLEIIAQLAKELNPHRHLPPLNLETLLDREYGFDSLSRVELLLRIEKSFGVKLAEQLLIIAETPRDILDKLQQSSNITTITDTIQPINSFQQALIETPYNAQTLVEVLEWHQATHPQRVHIHLYLAENEKAQEITYQELYDGARTIAVGLQETRHMPGDRVAIMLPTSREYLFVFYGILMAGGVPVPIYPPARPSQLEDHLRRHVKILNNAGVSHLITVTEAKLLSLLLKSQVSSLLTIATPTELMHYNNSYFSSPSIKPDDIAFLQYTSGSTGNPKGVVLTHRHLLANIRSMGEAVKVNSNDRFVSWLPLYHDMGLIGAWLSSLYFSCTLVLMSPLTFLVRPQRWLWAIHTYKATLSAAPHFAYELCLNKVQDSDIEGLDLSTWRMAFNGAEQVSPRTIKKFVKHFSQYGFQWQNMSPVYGLAECTVGLAFPPPERGPIIDQIERENFVINGIATPIKEAKENKLEFVACGQPLNGYEIRIVDTEGRELPERHEGKLQFCGPSTTTGYYHNPQQSQHLFDGKWLNSGDLAYMSGGDVYITSRTKDIIIRAGRNIYPYEVEEMVANIKGIRKGCVAVFSSIDKQSASERVIILAETIETSDEVKKELQLKISAVVSDLMGVAADEVLLVPPHTVLKTSSGKIRRAACRQQYEQDQLGQTQRPVWWQLSRMVVSSVLSQFNQFRRKILTSLFATYAWISFLILAPLAWILVVSLPIMKWRWTAMRSISRLLLFLTHTPLNIEGVENIPEQHPFVIVVNHASYLDGLILIASLTHQFSFVAKQEFQNNWFTHLFLRRIKTKFVERFDTKKGLNDSNKLIQYAHDGQSFAFFPEGTFTRIPGLLPFRMGAFSTAAHAKMLVVPIAIQGTRSILRAHSWFPRHGSVKVKISETISAKGSDWNSIIKLRDSAYKTILQHCGEPALFETNQTKI